MTREAAETPSGSAPTGPGPNAPAGPASPAGPAAPAVPETPRGDVVETRHGHRIPDPYRWLEDPDSEATRAWVAAQNAASGPYLDALPASPWFRDVLERIVLAPRASAPVRRGPSSAPLYLREVRDGDRDQGVLEVAGSLPDLLAAPRVLVDPNTWSEDGSASLAGWSVSRDGRHVAVLRSDGGSDWHGIRVLAAATGEDTGDALVHSKFSSATWLPDDVSFLHQRFDAEDDADGRTAAALGGGRIERHVLGTPQSEDTVVIAFDDPELTAHPVVDAAGRWLAVHVGRGSDPRGPLRLHALATEDGVTRIGAPIALVDTADAEWTVLRVDERREGDLVTALTDSGAPLGRIVTVEIPRRLRESSLAAGPGSEPIDATALVADGLVTLVAERRDRIEDARAAGDGLILVSLVDASPRLEAVAPDGALTPLDVTGGAVVALASRAGDDEAFVGTSTLTDPVAAWRVDVVDGTVAALPSLAGADADAVDPDARPELVVVRRSATSADGTDVPYFLVRRADLADDDPRPTLLYGYGGFDAAVTADFRPGWPAWVAAGGVLVLANLRGGGEYGSAWHEAGTRHRKQNVFDDLVAVADGLVADGTTTHAMLALHGRSNGGLLVGAVMTQRPDLAAVALPLVGVLDMTRFHRFTIGRAWIPDYGDPEDADDLAALLAYSPLHAVREGERYPATLVGTGDHDDRVVPAHSLKFTAALQHAQGGEGPILARIETSTGHGAGKPARVLAAEWADLLAFAAHHTGLVPPPRASEPRRSA